jgi:hypothetical protein
MTMDLLLSRRCTLSSITAKTFTGLIFLVLWVFLRTEFRVVMAVLISAYKR